jgi:LPXTG-motif cell wall-anchored protein
VSEVPGRRLEATMTTILIIVVLFVLLGGGYFGFRRR